jgi:hypothetical protein
MGTGAVSRYKLNRNQCNISWCRIYIAGRCAYPGLSVAEMLEILINDEEEKSIRAVKLLAVFEGWRRRDVPPAKIVTIQMTFIVRVMRSSIFFQLI